MKALLQSALNKLDLSEQPISAAAATTPAQVEAARASAPSTSSAAPAPTFQHMTFGWDSGDKFVSVRCLVPGLNKTINQLLSMCEDDSNVICLN